MVGNLSAGTWAIRFPALTLTPALLFKPACTTDVSAKSFACLCSPGGRQQCRVRLVCRVLHPHFAPALQEDRGGELQPGDGEHGFRRVRQAVL